MADNITLDGQAGRVLTDHTVRLALVEQNQEHYAKTLGGLADKFDRILDRMEQIALQNSSLITTQGVEIQHLRKEMQDTTEQFRDTQKEFKKTTEAVAMKMSKDLDDAVTSVESSVGKMQTTFTDQISVVTKRVEALEKWRLMVATGGLVVGAIIMKTLEWFGPMILGAVQPKQ